MFNKYNLKFSESLLEQKEIQIKKEVTLFVKNSDPYSNKNISNIQALLFFLLIPLCVIHLFFFYKVKFIFLDIVETDLSLKIFGKLKNAFWIKRFSPLWKRLFLQPLRIYSHTCREEWIYNYSFLKKLNQIGSFAYIMLFSWVTKNKVFFTREDFFSESSCLASISEIYDSPLIVGFQHGSMDLEKIKILKNYPGKRAKFQIVHDENTFNVFKHIVSDDKKILGPISSYECIKFSKDLCKKIFFIGNGDRLTQDQLLHVIKKISTEAKNNGFTIYYKPHPREREVVKSEDFILLDNSSERFVLAGQESKLLIGVTSTVLYDACLMNQRVLILKSEESKTLDSLMCLKNIKIIDLDSSIWLSINILLSSVDEPTNFTWNFESFFSKLEAGLSIN